MPGLDQGQNVQARRQRARQMLWGLVLFVPLSLLVVSGLVSAGPLLLDFTPTAYIYMPMVVRIMTPTPAPTATSSVFVTTDHVSGQLTLEDQTPGKTYAAKCEDVWHYDLIHNDDGSIPARWGIMGVNVIGPGIAFFHTSWSADQQVKSNLTFTLNPGCYGPNGTGDDNNPSACNTDANSAKHRDLVGGRQSDGRLMNAGDYQLTLAICLSPYTACTSGNGAWKSLSSVTIHVVDWYDPVKCPEGPHSAAAPTPAKVDPLAGCHLDLSNPNNIHMVCPGK